MTISNGTNAISYATLVIRGIANVEPITKYKVAKNKISAHFGRSRVSSSPRPKTDTITKVMNGINTPVTTKPNAAVAQCCPAV